jgi:hypothetical protein
MIISRHTRYYNRVVATRKQWEQKVKLGLLFDALKPWNVLTKVWLRDTTIVTIKNIYY